MLPRRDGPNAGAYDDSRTERRDTPQYQTDQDADLADLDCATCIEVL